MTCASWDLFDPSEHPREHCLASRARIAVSVPVLVPDGFGRYGKPHRIDRAPVVVDALGLVAHLDDDAHPWPLMNMSMKQRLDWMAPPFGVCWPGLMQSASARFAPIAQMLARDADVERYGLAAVAEADGMDPADLLDDCRLVHGVRQEHEARTMRQAATRPEAPDGAQ